MVISSLRLSLFSDLFSSIFSSSPHSSPLLIFSSSSALLLLFFSSSSPRSSRPKTSNHTKPSGPYRSTYQSQYTINKLIRYASSLGLEARHGYPCQSANISQDVTEQATYSRPPSRLRVRVLNSACGSCCAVQLHLPPKSGCEYGTELNPGPPLSITAYRNYYRRAGVHAVRCAGAMVPVPLFSLIFLSTSSPKTHCRRTPPLILRGWKTSTKERLLREWDLRQVLAYPRPHLRPSMLKTIRTWRKTGRTPRLLQIRLLSHNARNHHCRREEGSLAHAMNVGGRRSSAMASSLVHIVGTPKYFSIFYL